MLHELQQQFAVQMVAQAKASGHIFPSYAAAEACLESAWGYSQLCQRTNDVFGMKAPNGWTGRTITMHTNEIIRGVAELEPATWPIFNSYMEAFVERMAILKRLPLYASALQATSGEQYLREVSGHWLEVEGDSDGTVTNLFTFPDGKFQWVGSRWSTDPKRASDVLATYQSHPEIFNV